MAVAAIKEGALTVSTGQSQFPLTFQMPESGLALPERRYCYTLICLGVPLFSMCLFDASRHVSSDASPTASHLPNHW